MIFCYDSQDLPIVLFRNFNFNMTHLPASHLAGWEQAGNSPLLTGEKIKGSIKESFSFSD
jgi:hypothetical protein